MVLLFLLARRPRYHPISDSRFQISDLKMSRERDRPGCLQPVSRRVMVLLFLLARRRKWQAGRPRYHPISDSRFPIFDLKMSREGERPGFLQPVSGRLMVFFFLLARRRKWQAGRPRYHPISDFETTP